MKPIPIRFVRNMLYKSGSKKGKSYGERWLYECGYCGNTFEAYIYHVKRGKIKSCKCYQNSVRKKNATTHGMSRTPEYRSWESMLARCYNKNQKGYERWGGRGIKVCQRWRESFENFYEDMGPKPTKKHTIERINNDKDYTKTNCKWATYEEQANNKSNTIYVCYKGEERTLTEWSNITGIKYGTLYRRLKIKEWSIEKTLTKPTS